MVKRSEICSHHKHKDCWIPLNGFAVLSQAHWFVSQPPPKSLELLLRVKSDKIIFSYWEHVEVSALVGSSHGRPTITPGPRNMVSSFQPRGTRASTAAAGRSRACVPPGSRWTRRVGTHQPAGGVPLRRYIVSRRYMEFWYESDIEES